MLTVKEVADRLGVSPSTVYRWVNDGALPATRKKKPTAIVPKRNLGGSVRIAEADVVALEADTSIGQAA